MTTSVFQERKSRRSSVLLRGTIVYAGGTLSLDCTVRDLTPEGARLICAPSVPVPANFELVVPRWKTPRLCRLVWFEAGQCGIEFVTPAKVDGKGSEVELLRIRCAALELEVARLCQRLADLGASEV